VRGLRREDAASLYLKPGDVIEAEISSGSACSATRSISWLEAHGEPPPAQRDAVVVGSSSSCPLVDAGRRVRCG
jgi:hypothetical protein